MRLSLKINSKILSIVPETIDGQIPMTETLVHHRKLLPIMYNSLPSGESYADSGPWLETIAFVRPYSILC